MHSLISIVKEMLTEKDNYSKWLIKIKHTLIFNNLWDDIYEGEIVEGANGPIITTPIKPTTNKELDIWNSRDNKEYEMISTTISESLLQTLIMPKEVKRSI